MIHYDLHPLCTLFPRMVSTEFQALVSDIKAHGLREPIVLHDGLILDGGNRYRACVQAGVDPAFTTFCNGNPVSFVLSANLHRRHMTSGQQAAIVASAQDWANSQSVGRPNKSGNVTGLPDSGLDTVAKRAAQSGASDKTQRQADKVAKADPELAAQVAHGEVSLPKAVAQVEGKRAKKNPESCSPTEPKDPTPPEYTPLDEAMDTVRELQDALALANSGHLRDEDKTQAADLIARLREENRILTLKIKAVTASRDQYQTENGELKRQITRQRREIDKLAGTHTA